MRKINYALLVLLAPLLLMAQTSGPTIQTPRLTVGTGTQATAGNLRVNGNATITGTCTGCGATTPGGSNTQVQFNDGSAFGGDSGLTYNKTTDALTVAGALTVASCSGCAGAGATFAVKSADTSRTSNATPAIDTHLQFTSQAAGAYRVEAFLSVFSNSATPDLKTCFVASANLGTETAGGQAGRIQGDLMSAPVSPGNGIETSATWSTSCGNADVFQIGASTTATSIHFIGTVTLTGSATLSLFWSQNTSDATAVTLTAGSWMSVQKLN